MTVPRELHPRRGPHHPAVSTRPRRPGSVRRTTTHDTWRPDGLAGDVFVYALGRDLVTGADGSAMVRGSASLDAQIAFVSDRRVVRIRVEPDADLTALVGLRASSGFRQAMDAALPGEDGTRSLRYQLLDDLPTAVLVSGYALGAGGLHPPKGMVSFKSHADICAGWVTGGTILVEADELGYPPLVTGPLAPALTGPADPDAWHAVAELPPHGMRRWRRIDVWLEAGAISVEAFFRDSHVDADGVETVLHEYVVDATVDPVAQQVVSCSAGVGALPFVECVGAMASASRLVGTPVDQARGFVRDTFTGTTTCTHLNDTLRSLACVPYLAEELGR